MPPVTCSHRLHSQTTWAAPARSALHHGPYSGPCHCRHPLIGSLPLMPPSELLLLTLPVSPCGTVGGWHLQVVVPAPTAPVGVEGVQRGVTWLLREWPGAALMVLRARGAQLPAAWVLQALGEGSENDVRWCYLAHAITCLVHPAPSSPHPMPLRSSTACPQQTAEQQRQQLHALTAWGEEAAAAGLVPAALDSELALELVEACAREIAHQQQQQQAIDADPGAVHGAGGAVGCASLLVTPPPGTSPTPALIQGSTGQVWESATSTTRTHTLLPAGVKQHSLGAPPHTPPLRQAPTSRLQWLRGVLQAHLGSAPECDAGAVLAAIGGLCPYSLQQVLGWMVGMDGCGARLLISGGCMQPPLMFSCVQPCVCAVGKHVNSAYHCSPLHCGLLPYHLCHTTSASHQTLFASHRTMFASCCSMFTSHHTTLVSLHLSHTASFR